MHEAIQFLDESIAPNCNYQMIVCPFVFSITETPVADHVNCHWHCTCYFIHSHTLHIENQQEKPTQNYKTQKWLLNSPDSLLPPFQCQPFRSLSFRFRFWRLWNIINCLHSTHSTVVDKKLFHFFVHVWTHVGWNLIFLFNWFYHSCSDIFDICTLIASKCSAMNYNNEISETIKNFK